MPSTNADGLGPDKGLFNVSWLMKNKRLQRLFTLKFCRLFAACFAHATASERVQHLAHGFPANNINHPKRVIFSREVCVDFSDRIDHDLVLGLASCQKEHVGSHGTLTRNFNGSSERRCGLTNTGWRRSDMKPTFRKRHRGVGDHLRLPGARLRVSKKRCLVGTSTVQRFVHRRHATATLLKDWHEGHRLDRLKSVCPEMWGLGTVEPPHQLMGVESGPP